MRIGVFEILVILLVAFVLIGPEEFPKLLARLGKGLKELKKASAELTSDMQEIAKPIKELKKPLDEMAAPFKEALEPVSKIKEEADKELDLINGELNTVIEKGFEQKNSDKL